MKAVKRHRASAPHAARLAAPVGAILAGLRELQYGEPDFDPLTSDRKFGLYMIDGAIVYVLPALLGYLEKAAPRVHVQAVQCDVRHLDLWLESGLVDFALGPFLPWSAISGACRCGPSRS